MDAALAAQRFRELRQAGSGIEDALAALRREGANQIDSVKAVREVESVTLGDAKIVVDASPTWSDRLASNEALRDSVIKALEESGEL